MWVIRYAFIQEKNKNLCIFPIIHSYLDLCLRELTILCILLNYLHHVVDIKRKCSLTAKQINCIHILMTYCNDILLFQMQLSK